MKLARVISCVSIFIALLAPALPAAAIDSSCGCVCCVKNIAQSSGSGEVVVVVQTCGDDKSEDTKAEKVEDMSACAKTCGQKKDASGAQNYEVRSCNKGDCWCKNGKDAQFVGQTGAPDSCEQLCAAKKLEFGSWGTPLATETSMVKCPPGGMWTKDECNAFVDDQEVPIGDWSPPPGETKGAYCYVKQPPVKLNIAIGGLTVATLAEYLSAAFKLGIGVAAVLAVVFIMIGGFRYITAAGGSGVQGAKEMITNAVIGLFLTMFSYTMLQTVNPDILSLRLPRVQIVKACSVNVSCPSRHDKEACEKNDPNSGMRCVWNVTQSVCYDNSAMESGAVGNKGGQCSGDISGNNWSCSDGSKCITIDSNTHICSKGGSCQACVVDGDCATNNGAPGKCSAADHVCLIPDPSGQIGSYLKCGNGSCKINTDCDTGFCNSEFGRCQAANIGKICTGTDDTTSCASTQTCTKFVMADGQPKYACCLRGKSEGCLGCSSSGNDITTGCPKEMTCLYGSLYNQWAEASRKAGVTPDANLMNKCVNK
jgi:hypothetical protein